MPSGEWLLVINVTGWLSSIAYYEMNYAAIVHSALWSLLRNKMRSLLTVLGITIGIAAVICVVAIGKAGQARVEQQLNNLGDNLVWVEAGGRAVNGVRTGSHGTPTLTMEDALAIKAQVPLIKSVSANVDGSTQVVYGNQNWYTGYRGVSPSYLEIKRWDIDQGASFTQDDVDHAADVCVMGRTVREQLFGSRNPIGEVVRLKDLPCKVIGTLQPKGLSVSGQDQDDEGWLRERDYRAFARVRPDTKRTRGPNFIRPPCSCVGLLPTYAGNAFLRLTRTTPRRLPSPLPSSRN